MRAPLTPSDETERIWRLHALRILDTKPEERFDRFTTMAQRMFHVQTALVSLVDSDRQWFKSRCGLDATETSREVSFCGHAILDSELFVVNDASRDPRFAGNPLVTGPPYIRFYAGCPIPSGQGSALGTLCIIDPKPRQLSERDRELLIDLGGLVADELVTLEMATIDNLTGLSNRHSFTALATRTLDHARANSHPVSLLFVDLNKFKQINDQHGHEVGDMVLKDAASCIRRSFRSADLIARIGGDEFCVMLPNTGARQANLLVARLQACITRYNNKQRSKQTLPAELSCSIGVVSFDPTRHRDLADLLRDADTEMYRAKREQR